MHEYKTKLLYINLNETIQNIDVDHSGAKKKSVYTSRAGGGFHLVEGANTLPLSQTFMFEV